jgi:hypothetical protein
MADWISSISSSIKGRPILKIMEMKIMFVRSISSKEEQWHT